ncbi:MAG: DedA family protein [Gemmatimonadales bacterium]
MLAVYAAVAVAAVIENIFPPSPSDLVVALAAFLSHRGLTVPLTVFLVTWVSSVIGAVIVYYLSRTYGRGFFKGRLGRVLSSPEAIATMEREYLRFGLAGIVLGRLLPGVRSFVAPFTGLIGLSPARAILPMAIASGIWYAGIVILATFVGSEWDRIGGTIQRLNR